jgi:hypothetical protein
VFPSKAIPACGKVLAVKADFLLAVLLQMEYVSLFLIKSTHAWTKQLHFRAPKEDRGYVFISLA